jgi:hypothetical protein
MAIMIASKTITGEDLDLDPSLYGGKKLHGHAIIPEDATATNYLILGSIENEAEKPNMFVARISAADLSLGWTREYGNFPSTQANRLYLTSDQDILWGGSVTTDEQKDIRIVKVGKDSQLSFFGTPSLPLPSMKIFSTSVRQLADGRSLDQLMKAVTTTFFS